MEYIKSKLNLFNFKSTFSSSELCVKIHASLKSKGLINDAMNIAGEQESGVSVTFIQRLVANLLIKISEYLNGKIWFFAPSANIQNDSAFVGENGSAVSIACLLVAYGTQSFFSKRANEYKNHPLGLQMQLTNGVANGIIVVRSEQDCAKMIKSILLNEIEFDLVPSLLDDHMKDLTSWRLTEKLTQSTFRCITANRKLTNSFWNFYLVLATNRNVRFSST